MTEKIKKVQDDSRTIVKNFVRLVETVSLLVVAGFTFYASYKYTMPVYHSFVLRFAASVIGLRGGTEFLKYLANKDN